MLVGNEELLDAILKTHASTEERDLLIVACSKRKRHVSGLVPAIDLYDGPAFRVLRKRLDLSASGPEIWVLSAKHGLLWADTSVYRYDQGLSTQRIEELRPQIESFVERFAAPYMFTNIYIWAGRQYLRALPASLLERDNVHVAEGSIGHKLHTLKVWCAQWGQGARPNTPPRVDQWSVTSRAKRLNATYLSYFIPDWDDYLDPAYDFSSDRFSWDSGPRTRQYAHELFRWRPLYDGVLVSLGHMVTGKGLSRNGLKPNHKVVSARAHLHLGRHHLLMGDCGAFSYRRLPEPPFTTEQVVRMYTELGVDIGTSIDHIPFGEVQEGEKLRPLTAGEIEARIELTVRLAKEFLAATSGTSKFVPMGVIQARSKEEYASIATEYVKSGYRYIALGGLVPRADDDILEIAEAVVKAIEKPCPRRSSAMKVHLFGVLRESLFPELRRLGIASFDSGSYLRKAWLRSDKNYLSVSGEWYSAIRVPYSGDPRFVKNATDKGIPIDRLETLQAACLKSLRTYDKKRRGISTVLSAVMEYDSILLRTSDTSNLREKYKRTLEDTPWDKCGCPVCRSLGIDVVIFRGFNRNKRRGFHNTRVFYKRLREIRR